MSLWIHLTLTEDIGMIQSISIINMLIIGFITTQTSTGGTIPMNHEQAIFTADIGESKQLISA